MTLIDKATLIGQMSPPLDHMLAAQLMEEFIAAEQRFIQRDWEPAELDGGHFCEICARIYYHMDSGNLSQNKSFDDCLRYIENDQVAHVVQPRYNSLHVARVLKTIYKFRNQRGVAHISPTYTPNHMDAKFVVESVRWLMNETLRIFWNGDREVVAKAIRELLQFDVPAIGKFGDTIIVQRNDLTAEEELLVLLHYAGESGYSRRVLGKFAQFAPATITQALQRLGAPNKREIVQIAKDVYRLTDIGSKRVREQLVSKLIL
jgi:hypothetical protein